MRKLTSDNVVLKDTSKSFFSFMLKPVTGEGSKCASSQVTCDINTSAQASHAHQSSSVGTLSAMPTQSPSRRPSLKLDVRSCAVKGTERAWPTRSEDMHVDYK